MAPGTKSISRGAQSGSRGEAAWQVQAKDALRHYKLDVSDFRRLNIGLVNLTIKVKAVDESYYILQRLNPVFDRAVNQNIEVVTSYLSRLGVMTPRLLRTTNGAVDVQKNGKIWRLLSFIDGKVSERCDKPEMAREAGRLLANFHRSLLGFREGLEAVRQPIHDIARHLDRLAKARDERSRHPLYDDVCRLSEQISLLRGRATVFTAGRERLVHGDPKISNIVFDEGKGDALCMIDLDTLSFMPLAWELGDAFRSWCNPAGEDHPEAFFDIELFRNALVAYAGGARDFIEDEEVRMIVPATLEIHLELAVRFLTDALEEKYFSWESGRYSSLGEHNLARARGQLAAAMSLTRQLKSAEQVVFRTFS